MVDAPLAFAEAISLNLPLCTEPSAHARYRCRLASVRRKIERWMPGTSTVALWSVDFGEVCAAGHGVDAAMRAFDDRIGRVPDASVVWTQPIVDALTKVELSLATYERSLLANVKLPLPA